MARARAFHGKRFDELFIAMQTQGLLPIGLLRCPGGVGLQSSAEHPSHPYIFSAPMQGACVEAGAPHELLERPGGSRLSSMVEAVGGRGAERLRRIAREAAMRKRS